MPSSLRAVVDDKEYRERLRWHLQRGETWIGNADTKATVALSLNGAIVAVLTAIITFAKNDLVGVVKTSETTQGLVILFCLSLLISIVAAALAILPSIGRRNSNERSLYHFLFVAEYQSADVFRPHYRQVSDSDDLKMLENMVWVNARVSTTKFRKVQVSVWGLLVSLVSGLSIAVVATLLP